MRVRNLEPWRPVWPLLLFAVALAGAQCGDAKEGAADQWLPLARLGLARQETGAARIGNEVYVAGGLLAGLQATAAVEIYDLTTGQWRFGEHLPVALDHMAVVAAALGGKIFAAGGEVPMLFAMNEAYDIGSNTWSTATPMAVPRHGVSAVSLGDRILAPGGGTVQGLQPTDYVDAYRPEAVGIEEQPTPIAPILGLPAPNPCPAGASLSLTLEQPQLVRVVIADVMGRKVRVLVDGIQVAGRHSLRWDGRDTAGQPVPAGVYWIRLDRSGRAIIRKLVVAP